MILRSRHIVPLSQPIIHNGGIVVENGRVIQVGNWNQIKSTAHGETVDLGESILFPGLINTHCHLDYTGMAGLLTRSEPFSDWIKELVALKAAWTYSDYAQSWIRGARMLLNHGVTTVVDNESIRDLLPDVWDATRLKVTSLIELLNIKSWRSASQLVNETLEHLDSLPLAEHRVGLAPHAPYTTSPELIRLSSEKAAQRQWPLSIHVSESRDEFDMFFHGHGPLYEWLASQRDQPLPRQTSPIQYLHQLGLLSPGAMLVHCNYLAPNDARSIARNKSSVIHCPRSHHYFNHAPFPYEELVSAGVNICLATDSLASVRREKRKLPVLELFSEMRLFWKNHPELMPETLLRMVTTNAAAALNRQGQIGELSPGAGADMAALPYHGSEEEILEHIIGCKKQVSHVWIEGQKAL